MSDDEEFTPRLGKPKSRGKGKGCKYLGAVIGTAARAGMKLGKRGARFDGSRIGRGASIGRVLASRDRLAGFRGRRAVVKMSYTRLASGGLPAARVHLTYLQRGGVSRDGGPGQLYSPGEDVADGRAFLERATGDERQFRFIVSAEDGDQYPDLKPFVRRLMAQMERDLGTKLDWVAVDHYDTGHPHTHIVLRGVDDRGHNLLIGREYVAGGMRQRAIDLVNRDLGPRTTLEIEERLRHDVGAERLTAIDRRMLREMDGDRIVAQALRDPFQQSLRTGRLRKLEEMGLAEAIGGGRWQLAEGLDTTLRRIGERGDIIRTMQREISARGKAGAEQAIYDATDPQAAPLVGRVIGRGLADELYDRHYLLVEGIDGRSHYIDLGRGDAVAAPAAAQTKTFDVPAQSAATGIPELARQADIQILVSESAVQGLRTREVKGRMPIEQALRRLIAGTGLRIASGDGRTYTLARETGQVGNDVTGSAEGIASDERSDAATPDILVVGRRTLNVDVRRTENDAQPYVVFDRQAIKESGSTSVGEFIRNNVPMSNVGIAGTRLSGNSKVSLRGLGVEETLVLINGRRTAMPRFTTEETQTDLNAIPIAAIDRIEILPTSASGIYGGSATGGVINVILRQDYKGLSVTGSYGDTFQGGGRSYQLDAAGGFSIGSRTSVMMGFSYLKQEEILASQRDFIERGRAILLKNNPAALEISGIIPPMGTTTNYRSANGAPLFGPGTPSYGMVPIGYNGQSGLAGLLPGAGQYNLAVSDTLTSFGGGNWRLEPEVERIAANASVTHDFGDGITGFVETFLSQSRANQGAAPTTSIAVSPGAGNPFGTSVIVSVPTSDIESKSITTVRTASGSAGITAKIDDKWSLALEGGASIADYRSASGPNSFLPTFNSAVTNGTINVFRDTSAFPLDLSSYLAPPISQTPFTTTSYNASLRVAGTLFELPGGPVKATTLAEWRNERFREARSGTIIFPHLNRIVTSLYGEANVPLISSSNRKPGLELLELNLAGRLDRYWSSTASSHSPTILEQRFTSKQESVSPTLSFRYSPIVGMMIRGSFGTGFLPPNSAQLSSLVSTGVNNVVDPRRGNTLTVLPAGTVTSGGNPNVRPESSKTWSMGFVFEPQGTGLRFSADYVRIIKQDNIQSLSIPVLLGSENLYPGRVTRGPLSPGDPYSVGPITALDISAINLDRLTLGAIDFRLGYSFGLFGGELSFDSALTWQVEYKTRLNAAAPTLDRLGIAILGAPIEFKGSGNVTWSNDRIRLRWDARYFGGYRLDSPQIASGAAFNNALSNGGPDVGGTLYHDLFVGVQVPKIGFSKGAEVQLHLNNIFNTRPRFDPAGGNASSYANGYDDMRLRSFVVGLKLDF